MTADQVAVIEHLRRHTGMHVPEVSFVAVCSFVAGYDLALNGLPLRGFREWLALRLRWGSNLSWDALVLQLVPNDPVGELPQERCLVAQHQRE